MLSVSLTLESITVADNCVSNFAGIAVPPCTGFLKARVGWEGVWLVAAAINLVAAAVWQLASTGDNIEAEWLLDTPPQPAGGRAATTPPRGRLSPPKQTPG